MRLEMESTKHAMELKLLEAKKEHQIELLKLQEESSKRQAETTHLILKSQEDSAKKIADVVQSITNRQPSRSLSDPDPYDYFPRIDVFSNYPYTGQNRFIQQEHYYNNGDQGNCSRTSRTRHNRQPPIYDPCYPNDKYNKSKGKCGSDESNCTEYSGSASKKSRNSDTTPVPIPTLSPNTTSSVSSLSHIDQELRTNRKNATKPAATKSDNIDNRTQIAKDYQARKKLRNKVRKKKLKPKGITSAVKQVRRLLFLHQLKLPFPLTHRLLY